MTLTAGFSSARDLFEKLRRDAAALDEEVTADRFFNFVLTGYSLVDWVKHDPTALPSAQTAAGAFACDRWIKVCGDLATASKHFALSFRKPITQSAVAERGYGKGRYGKGTHGEGEEGITVQLNDGMTYSCLDLVQGVVSSWESFFAAHGI